MATKEQVIRLNKRYPAWTARQIAEKLGTIDEYVRATAARNGLTLGRAKNFKKRMKGDTIDELGRAARERGLTVEMLKQISPT